jgi:L-asparaginase II
MLLACLAAGLDPSTYLRPDHPLQRRALVEMAAFAGLEPVAVGVGVDGCGVPAFHLPLAALARAYAALADSTASGLSAERGRAARRVRRAMTAAPGLVAGEGRFTTRLMEVTGGRVLGKEGAQGVYAVSLPEPGRGVAVKIADGSGICRDAVVLEVLRQLDSLTCRELDDLEDLRTPTLRNWTGGEVGDVVVDFRLTTV